MKMAICPLFLIVFYWSSQNLVGTEPIPKEHSKEAILCLREYLGEEDHVHKTFRNQLSYGEYLGDICECANVNAIEKKIKEDGQENGQKVQLCLAKKNQLDVYTKFLDYGSEKWTEESDETNVKNISNLGKFIKGLCLKDDSVDFQELKNDQDKEAAFNCLKNCTANFLMRIKVSLYQIKREVANILEDEREDFMSDFGEKTNINAPVLSIIEEVRYEKQKISKDVEPSSSHTSSDIDRITTAGKALLTSYAEAYTFIDKYIEARKRQDKYINLVEFNQVKVDFNENNDHKSLDVQMIVHFNYYKYCARVECYMKAPKSVPLYDFIHEKVNERNFDLQEKVLKPLPEHKFYVTLISDLRDYNDDDDDNRFSVKENASI